jgi:hypothetical protein
VVEAGRIPLDKATIGMWHVPDVPADAQRCFNDSAEASSQNLAIGAAQIWRALPLASFSKEPTVKVGQVCR